MKYANRKVKETIKWNLGILVINIGHKVRDKLQIRGIGRFIIRLGYKLRGKMPHRTWKGVHV